jgi:hypothetical protein
MEPREFDRFNLWQLLTPKDRLGASSKANKPSIWETIDVDGNDFPRAIFNFKYRSKGKHMLNICL